MEKKFDKKAFEKEYKEKKEKEADKIEMVSKLAKRKKVPIKEALINFDYQKTIDKYRDINEKKGDKKGVEIFSSDVISDPNLSDREGSFKKGGLVKQGKPKIAKKGWK